MTLSSRQFHPHQLAYGEEVTVDPEEFAAHPDIRRDERDPRLGGHAMPFIDSHMDTAVPAHGMDLKYEERRSSLTGDQYLDAIANSMAAVGQQHPGILFSDPTGQKPYWLGEGNHRLAAARRTGQPFRVKRRDKG